MIIRDFVERCHRGLGALGLSPATHDEIVEGRALAARTVSPNIATVETLAQLQDLTQASSFTFRSVNGQLAGVMAIRAWREAAPNMPTAAALHSTNLPSTMTMTASGVLSKKLILSFSEEVLRPNIRASYYILKSSRQGELAK